MSCKLYRKGPKDIARNVDSPKIFIIKLMVFCHSSYLACVIQFPAVCVVCGVHNG